MSGTKRLMRPTPAEWERLGNFTYNGANALTYSSIPQTYTQLRVLAIMQSNRSGYQNTGGLIRINGDASAIYTRAGRYVTSSGAADAPSRGVSAWYLGQIPAGSRGTDDMIATAEITFPFYARTDITKTYLCQSAGDDGTNVMYASMGGSWMNTAAITSIALIDDVGSALGPRARAELWAA